MRLSIQGLSVAEKEGLTNTSVETIEIDAAGVTGDRHAGPGIRQVALLTVHTAERLATLVGAPSYQPGTCKENILLDGLEAEKVKLLDRFRIGTALLEVTQLGALLDAEGDFPRPEKIGCTMDKHGVFARVIEAGNVGLGDLAAYLRRVLRVKVITMSDRASRGDYEDKSGPRAREILESYCAERAWTLELTGAVLPDDAAALETMIRDVCDAGVDLVITTGGTGIGPRDVTPEVVVKLADKLIPGIIEHIRVKYGQDKPAAQLSRGVAAVAGRTLLYAIPGSVRAVDEYLAEILKTLEHAMYIMRGLDPH